jgi:hypothetical protein
VLCVYPQFSTTQSPGNITQLFSIKYCDPRFKEEYLKLQSFTKFAASLVATAALGTAMFVAVPAYADDRAKCQHKIESAESKLDQAIRKHGERSHQAEDRRRDLNAERERCWNAYHGWWDGHEHRWHDARDWDDHH